MAYFFNDIRLIWEGVKQYLVDSGVMTESAVNLWFGELKADAMEGDNVYMSTPSEFKYTIIVDKKYIEKLEKGFSDVIGRPIKVELCFLGDPHEPGDKEVYPTPDNPYGGMLPPFNFEYTFDNFIVGSSNKFAHAACYAVAKHPAQAYNPLFIYGPSGIGKTHLLYAITNEIKKNNPNIKVLYIKGDDFTNQMIESLANKEMALFHEKYRKCDVLLIDDIQFIAGKTSTQEEFFHTFNSLYEAHKQIILTSDRPPREIQTLEDRLKTRFEWGLIADIQPPDLELRIAILKKKAEQVNIKLPEDVLTFLAENLRSNVRQIEGAIKKLGALCFLSGKTISLETAEGCIAELLGGEEPASVTVEKIFAAVYKKYGISKEDLIGQKRNKEIAATRHIANYLIREITEMSYPNIAKIFGRNHSTVISSIEIVEKKIKNDKAFELEIENLKKEITVKN